MGAFDHLSDDNPRSLEHQLKDKAYTEMDEATNHIAIGLEYNMAKTTGTENSPSGPQLKDGGTRKTYNTGAQKEDDSKTEGKGAYHLLPVLAIREVAEIFRKGAIKYDAWNWQKGIPLSRFMDSMKRHADQEWEGLVDENHKAQAAWNALCYIQTLIMIERGLLPPTLDDRPAYGAPGDPNYRPPGPGFGLPDEDKGKWLDGEEED